MPSINQLSKTGTLKKGYQITSASAGQSQYTYPQRISLWGLIQYLSTGVFQYLTARDYIQIPGVPFANLPDPVGLMGARATVTDAAKAPDTLMTVGQGVGQQFGFLLDGINDFGSLSQSVFTPLDAEILALYWIQGVPEEVWFIIDGVFPDSGWTSLIINGTSFARASAANFTNSNPFFPGMTVWQWTGDPNPFSAEGEVDEVYFDSAVTIGFYSPVKGGGSTKIGVFSDDEVWRAG